MASDRAIFLRPLVVTASNYQCKMYSVTSASVLTSSAMVQISTGTHSTVESLKDDLNSAVSSWIGTASCAINSDYKFVFTHGGGEAILLDLANYRTFGKLIGHTQNIPTYKEPNVADYIPEYVWFPTYVRSNREYFHLNQSKVFNGLVTQAGTLAGLGTGTSRREMAFEYPHEPAANVADEFTTTTVETVRCFEHFAYWSRAATPHTDGTSMKGFYYFPDYTVAQNDSINGDGSIRFADGSDFVFCQMLRPPDTPLASIPRARSHFNLSFRAVTSTAPTWDNY